MLQHCGKNVVTYSVGHSLHGTVVCMQHRGTRTLALLVTSIALGTLLPVACDLQSNQE
jgi:hypothetical protein